ncbi:inhibitor of Bruton tyrosine kinase-like [Clavelina lepadiformis]|uniref:inhibitor of Bruton tyrosine kinase-like n=1 Tax=Clavelina lepadiformis TaxID=159417 RepID=UPI004040EE76
MDDICLKKCNFVKCVDDLNCVITKGTVHQVKEYVHCHCYSALTRFDKVGRLPLHIAASCGKSDVIEWLCQHMISTNIVGIDTLDLESGWTALQRALYYGRIPCVMVLLQHGASMWWKDFDGCNVLDMVMKDISPWVHEPALKRNKDVFVQNWNDLRSRDNSDIYTWGVNENMTLAQGNQKSRKLPELVDFFARKCISIKQVIMCKFHSVFLTHGGEVFSCGTGRGGRLGVGYDDVFIDPQRVDVGGNVIGAIAAAIDHTVFVTVDGQLYTCGLNHYRTSGINPPPEKNDFPTRVIALKDKRVIGCSAGQCHTVAWTTNALFTFGTNAGQLGHGKGDLFVISPRRVSAIHRENDVIVDVNASDAATVVVTSQGIVYLLYNYVCRKILTKHLDILKVRVGGGRLDPFLLQQVKSIRTTSRPVNVKEDKHEREKSAVKVLILKKSGDLISWISSKSTTDRCQFDLRQIRYITDVAISNNGAAVLLTSYDGTAYLGHYSTWHAGKKKGSSTRIQEFASSLELSDSDSIQKFRFDQVTCAFRCHTAVLGPKGRNAALLQSDPRNFITQVPTVNAEGLNEDFQCLLSSAHDDDLLHDVIIRVKKKQKPDVIFAAHQFVLATKSSCFAKLLLNRPEFSAENVAHLQISDRSTPHLIIENVHSKILNNCLEFMYCGKCELLHNGMNAKDQLPDLGKIKIYWEGYEPKNDHSLNACIGLKTNNGKQFPGETDVLTLFKRLAMRLEIRGLEEKFFNNLTFVKDLLVMNNDSLKVNDLILTPRTIPELYDCQVECDDEMTFSAHKCVLAARIPFFQGMLLSPWLEASGESMIAKLKVPVPSDIFRYVIDFAYTDSETSLHGSGNLEALCELLAAADLLLMDRLKQVVEVQIVPRLTLKNLAFVIEVALAFNATQLYESCLQFACFHLAALLHTPSFHSVEMFTLEKLESVYRSNLSNVYMRSMPPYLSGPEIDHISNYDGTSSVDKDGNFSRPSQASSPKRRSVTSAQINRRKSSVKKSLGIMVSDLLKKTKADEENDILERIITPTPQVLPIASTDLSTSCVVKLALTDKKAEVTLPISPSLTVASPRLASKPKGQPSGDDGKASPSITIARESGAFASKYNKLFPQLGSPPSKETSQTPTVLGQVLPNAADISSKSSDCLAVTSGSSGALPSKQRKKLSQKEKRRMREEQEQKKNAPPSVVVETKPLAPNAWGVIPKRVETPGEIFSPPLDVPLKSRPTVAPLKSPTTKLSDGPWKHIPASPSSPPAQQNFLGSPTGVLSSPTSFIEIVQSEETNRERAERIKKKPLSMIQLEDQAMSELKVYYESKLDRGDKDFFTVSRVSDEVAREIFQLRKKRNE